ncbi:HIT family protein [Lottiidibacillus patelloidae]|uniref:HIT family protein n=1 Tax=Lottiidibacillus patelloidae TaxID=2670334 RepID=A0A263BQ87_9BACI|nr:HIT family protein [Lottiidibacillus patelloidae]OZM55738.1 HIT family protein [Lottiidibacillus patelloidae]
MNECPLCHIDLDEEQKVTLENEYCMFLQKPQEVLIGSGLIIPKRHCETVFNINAQEWKATYELLHEVKQFLDVKYKPDGYNIGWNVSETGGQHIMHAHMHVIPRFNDEPLAGKGIRNALKSKENMRR